MLGQNVLLELVEGDRVQLYAYTATGIFDHKSSRCATCGTHTHTHTHCYMHHLTALSNFHRYTQFIGLLLRPSVDSLHDVVRRLGSATDLDDLLADEDEDGEDDPGEGGEEVDAVGFRSNNSTLRSNNGTPSGGRATNGTNSTTKQEVVTSLR